MREKKKENKGITLIALIITIIVMLILVGVTINLILGENGIITKAGESKEATEIAMEKEVLGIASLTSRIDDGGMNQDNLQKELNGMKENTEVEDMQDGTFLVVFPSKRAYEVKEDGSVEYLGKKGEIDRIVVTIDKESDLSRKQIQEVEMTVKRYNLNEDKNISLQYAWNTSKTEAPKIYKNAQFEEDEDGEEETISINKMALIDSGDQKTGNYYLWIRVKMGNDIVMEKVYGEYYIEEFMTLVRTINENKSTSGFLGNDKIQRGRIKSIIIKDTREGKTVENDENCWDVGTKKEGVILAWYEEETASDGEKCYNVTIGQDGGVVAHTYSDYLFSNIGSDLTEEITIDGLENLKTDEIIGMGHMFENDNGLKTLDLSSFHTNKVISMSNMFYGCSGLEALDLSTFDTSKVKSMRRMFESCSGLKNLDLKSFETNLVTDMYCIFYECSNLKSINVSSFDTGNVKSMGGMFAGCSNLQDINVDNFNTAKVSSFYAMFARCTSLQELDLTHFNTSNLSNMYAMFTRVQ